MQLTNVLVLGLLAAVGDAQRGPPWRQRPQPPQTVTVTVSQAQPQQPAQTQQAPQNPPAGGTQSLWGQCK